MMFVHACEVSVSRNENPWYSCASSQAAKEGFHVRKIVDMCAFGERGSGHDRDGCHGGHRPGTAAAEAGGNPALRPPPRQSRGRRAPAQLVDRAEARFAR